MAVVFDINHEDGTTAEWTGGVDAGITAHSDAALQGTSFGLKITFAGANLDAEVHFASGNTNCRMRFYYDFSNMTPQDGDSWDLYQFRKTATNNGYLQIRKSGSQWQVQPRMRTNAGTFPTPGYGNINESGWLEIDMKAGVGNAHYKVYADGDFSTPISEITGETWDSTGSGGTARWPFDDMRFGGPSSVHGSTTGDMYADEFVCNNDGSKIGSYLAPTANALNPSTSGFVVNYTAGNSEDAETLVAAPGAGKHLILESFEVIGNTDSGQVWIGEGESGGSVEGMLVGPVYLAGAGRPVNLKFNRPIKLGENKSLTIDSLTGTSCQCTVSGYTEE